MKYLIPVLSLSLVVACGKSESGAKNPKLPLVTNTNLESNYIQLKKQNSNCIDGAFQDFNIPLHLLLKGIVFEEDRDLTGFISGNFIKNDNGTVISDSFFGGAEDTIITDYKYVEYVKRIPSTKLTVCPEDLVYERATYESAGLNVSYFINKTYKKIKSILPSLDIKPVSLNIAPELRILIRNTKADKIEEQVRYSTDNAFYEPEKKSITILPHSYKKKSEGQESNFWEVPMVASHEYGHHIFSTIAPNVGIQDFHMGKCFEAGDFILQGRTVNHDLVLSAMNEGFADLIAFYTLSAEERSLKGVLTLETNRDVDSNKFSTGMSKKFSDITLKIFFMPYRITTTEGFQGIHVVGAMFANGADKFLNTLSADNDKKLEITMTWLQEVNTYYSEMKSLSPQDLFKRLMTMYIEQAMKKTESEYSPAICAEIDKFYPNLKSTLVGCGVQTITI